MGKTVIVLGFIGLASCLRDKKRDKKPPREDGKPVTDAEHEAAKADVDRMVTRDPWHPPESPGERTEASGEKE